LLTPQSCKTKIVIVALSGQFRPHADVTFSGPSEGRAGFNRQRQPFGPSEHPDWITNVCKIEAVRLELQDAAEARMQAGGEGRPDHLDVGDRVM